MRFERAMPNERYDLFMTNRAELVDSFRTHTQSYIHIAGLEKITRVDTKRQSFCTKQNFCSETFAGLH